MDMKRLMIALVAALIIASGATYFFYNRIRAMRSAKPADAKIVVATASLTAGSPVAAENVKLVDWPASVKLPNSFNKPEDVIGRSLIYPVGENQPLLERDVAMPGSGIGLTVKIPEGMRAVSVRSNEIVGVAGFLYPGSHVDVLATSRIENQPTPVTQTVLQNVEVLTAGQRIEPDPKGKPETVNVVTLLLTPQDGEKLVLATTQGTVHFVLRNGADQNTTPTKPVGMAELMSGTERPTPKKVVPTKVVAAKLPSFYEVETLTVGGKKTVDKFDQ